MGERRETIYCYTILARLTLEKYIGVKGIKAGQGKRNLSRSIVNAIGGKYSSVIDLINRLV